MADLNYLRSVDTRRDKGILKEGLSASAGLSDAGRIADPYGVEGGGEAEGLGYLDIDTVFEKEGRLSGDSHSFKRPRIIYLQDGHKRI